MAKTSARVKWIEGMQMLGESGSGHTLVMDAGQAVGGRDRGMRPMELLLLGMGGCASIDVLSILRKDRHTVSDCVATLEGVRAEIDPKVYLEIHMHFTITGQRLPAKAVERAIRLSKETYGSASAMLGKTASIQITYDILEG